MYPPVACAHLCCAGACLWMDRAVCKFALPALPYDPGEQGDPLHAVAPASSKEWERVQLMTMELDIIFL